jgi:hypothetical protein
MALRPITQTMLTRSIRALRTVAIIAVITLAMAETAARLVPEIPSMIRSLEPERAWEDRFLEMMHRDGTLVMGGFHRPHPTRGLDRGAQCPPDRGSVHLHHQ